LLVVLSIVSGCATHASNVAPTSVSSLQYDGVDCKRLAIESADINMKLSTLSAKLDSKADADTALVAGSLILWPFLIGLAATGGKAEEAEVARLKGEKIAIEQTSLRKNCGV
jgi:hypothetical protein